MSEKLRIINSILEIAEKEGYIDKLVKLFSRKRTVLVLGTSGVGKTSLLNSLRGFLPHAIDCLNRTEIAKRHRIALDGTKMNFVDTPGQEHHESRRIRAIRESMKSDRLGVMNVTCFGYHEHSTGVERAFSADGNVSEDYLKERRSLEVSGLDEWISLLGDSSTTSWLMTVVTKADLWWDRREEVTEHYKNGEYGQRLYALTPLHPVVVEFCSVIHRFYGHGQICSTFDDSVRDTLLQHLVSTIVDAAKTS